MNRYQRILVALTSLAHVILAALCVWADTPSPGNYHDVLPLLTMFLAAPFLSTGATLIVAGITCFWRKTRRPWMAFTSLGAMLVSFLLVHHFALDEPFLWVYLFPWVMFQYGCSMITLCAVRRVFRKLSAAPGKSTGN